MTIDEIVRQTLREWSGDARVPADLADRALGRRRRAVKRAFAVVAGATAGVVAVFVVPGMRERVAQPIETLEHDRTVTVQTDPGSGREVLADPDGGPPEKLVAAYDRAVYAYHIRKEKQVAEGAKVVQWTWFVYDTEAGTYKKAPWAMLDVAPGGETVAVLEELPARRVGVVATRGGPVRWIDLERPAAWVSWSPDGRRLLVTNYDWNPLLFVTIPPEGGTTTAQSIRTGFTVVDVEGGRAAFHEVGWTGRSLDRGKSFRWSADGTMVWEWRLDYSDGKVFYDLEGNVLPIPEKERNGSFQEAGLSPSGRWLADDPAALAVTDTETGRTVPLPRAVAGHRIMQLLAWADDDHLIAWACELKGSDCAGGGFRNRLVVISRDGMSLTPLTGFRADSRKPGSWEPLVGHRRPS
ncbi:hypothetical protein ACFFMN_16375 [Planobispora siamensis]|uniref:WD40 repeat domain-containing protein n=1 Tax=Planobispora siamensis TaxID=936338 RepID=A0A8J3SGE2_9ACTN|nr:hypothetical protein [Planobispora siamensis]GIH93803.1 hypothetical protein Psi01_44330 [Planobispora siamensis]